MGKPSKDKGKRGERRWVKYFKRWFPKARRARQSEGAVDSDVSQTPYWIEVKEEKTCKLRQALRQAERDTDGRPCVAACHDTTHPHEEWIVMRPEAFTGLLDAIHGSGSTK